MEEEKLIILLLKYLPCCIFLRLKVFNLFNTLTINSNEINITHIYNSTKMNLYNVKKHAFSFAKKKQKFNC
jgi:hypothetical protein